MKDISFSVSDNNYTIQAETKVSLDGNQDDTLKKLVHEIERGLFTEKAQYLCIDGLLNKRVVLTITEYEDKMH
jgi:hypothetical protein